MATWSLHTGSVTGNAATAAVSMAAAVAVADTLSLSPVLAGITAAVGALTTVVITGIGDNERLGVHLGRWAAAGGWTTWAIAHPNPWTMWGIGALAAGCVIGAALTPMLNRHADQPKKEATGTGLVVGATSRRNLDWSQRLSRVCGIKGTQCNTTDWDNGAGYDVYVTLPEGGATRRDITMQVDALASDADLPDGCGIRVVASGKGRRTLVLKVGTVNRLREFIDYPVDKPWTSMLDPKVFGETASGDPASALLRESSQLIVGPPGSGKTTQLQVLTAECAKTTDGLVWHLDLNGGGLSQPWVDLWIDGKLQRCPIDWPAANQDECMRALKAGIRIAKHRKVAYRKRKREANATLLPIGPDLPAINVILDEGAEATSNRKIEALLTELQNIARDSACLLRLSALSPTGDMVPPPMRRNTGTRTAMYSPDEEIYSFMSGFGAGRSMTNDDLAGKGTGFMVDQGGSPIPFRGYNITPAMIEQVAIDVAKNRVDLDTASREAAGEDYATRWGRVRQAFTADGVDDTPVEAVVDVDADDVMDAVAEELGDEDWTAGWGDPFGDEDEVPRRTVVREVPVTSTLPAAGSGPVKSTAIDDILVGALRVMADTGSDRATREQLASRLTGGDEDVLRDRMKKAGCCPVHPLKVDGKPARGWYRRDIEDAMSSVAA